MLIRLLSVVLMIGNVAFQAMAVPHAHVSGDGSTATVARHVHVVGRVNSHHEFNGAANAQHSHLPSGKNITESSSIPLAPEEHDEDAIYVPDVISDRGTSNAATDDCSIFSVVSNLPAGSIDEAFGRSADGLSIAIGDTSVEQCRLYIRLRNLRI